MCPEFREVIFKVNGNDIYKTEVELSHVIYGDARDHYFIAIDAMKNMKDAISRKELPENALKDATSFCIEDHMGDFTEYDDDNWKKLQDEVKELSRTKPNSGIIVLR